MVNRRSRDYDEDGDYHECSTRSISGFSPATSLEPSRVRAMLEIMPYFIDVKHKGDRSKPQKLYRLSKTDMLDSSSEDLSFNRSDFESVVNSDDTSGLLRILSILHLTKELKLFKIDEGVTNDPLYSHRKKKPSKLFQDVLRANSELLYLRISKEWPGIVMDDSQKKRK
ncbi:MAG: hypothetical protein AABW73_05135 [Nanoarchaeota archaeon]